MKRNTLTVIALYGTAALMIAYCLKMLPLFKIAYDTAGWNIYSTVWAIVLSGYFITSIYTFFVGPKGLVKCMALMIIMNVICTLPDAISVLITDDDVLFGQTILRVSFTIIELILLSLYLMGLRQNSRRLVLVLGIQTYLELLYIADIMHEFQEFILVLEIEILTVWSILFHILMIILFTDRRISDQPIDKSSRDNGDFLFKSLGCGTMITISERDYELITSDDRSSWHTSIDPAVEKELNVVAKELRGGYEIIAQKFHCSDEVRLTFHNIRSTSFVNPIAIDIVCVKRMDYANGYDKIRVFGKEGMFIDLLIDKSDNGRGPGFPTRLFSRQSWTMGLEKD